MSMTRPSLILLLAWAWAGPATAQEDATYPRQRLIMDYGWTFTTGDAVGAESPDFDDGAWRSVDLPHDWSIEGPYDRNAATTGRGGYLPTGVGWYRRTFAVPEAWAGRRVTVEFDGVYQNSDVWINGHHLGNRPNGYTSFQYDLTPHLVPGGNVVAVRVDNSRQPNSRWYSGSGIYRHVWLTVTHPVHFARWGTYITTPDVSAEEATVLVEARTVNDGGPAFEGTLNLVVLDGNGREVTRATRPWSVAQEGEASGDVSMRLETPSLWSPHSPALYTLRTTLLDSAGDPVDEIESAFGVRDIAFDADRGFLLNGVRVKMLGATDSFWP